MSNTIKIKSTPKADRSIKIEDGDELKLEWTLNTFISSGGGFGCAPNARGSAIFGHWKHNGRDDRVERGDVTEITKAPNSPEEVKRDKMVHRLESLKGLIDTQVQVFKEVSDELNKIHEISFLYELKDHHTELSETMEAIIDTAKQWK